MTRPHHVDLDAADNLITAAVLMVGDNNHAVLALVMTAAAQLILDANETPARAVAAAAAAGPPLGRLAAPPGPAGGLWRASWRIDAEVPMSERTDPLPVPLPNTIPGLRLMLRLALEEIDRLTAERDQWRALAEPEPPKP
jgi:hypothetical protein